MCPGLFSEQLKTEFQLTAEEFSKLGSYYLYAYAMLQIPLGLLIDRIGIRKMVILSLNFCILGQFLFYYSSEYTFVLIGRFLIGAGSAAALMSALKSITDFFPENKKGLFIGLTQALGTLSVMVSSRLLLSFAQSFGGHKNIFFSLGILGIIILLVIIFTTKNTNSDSTKERESKCKSLSEIKSNILNIFSSKPIMLYALMALALYTPLCVLADLWGSSFLLQKYGFSSSSAAKVSTSMYLGLTFGSLFLPYFCVKNNFLNRGIQLSCLAMALLYGFLLFASPDINKQFLQVIIIAIGFFCGSEMMCFTGASKYTNQNNSGITFGIVNTFNMLGSAFFQHFIGYFLDFQWSGELSSNGLRVYQTEHFVISLSSLLVVIVLSLLVSLLPLKK